MSIFAPDIEPRFSFEGYWQCQLLCSLDPTGVCSLSSMHSYNDYVVKITVITKVVLFYGTLNSELRALGVCVCVSVRDRIRGECVREAEREGDGPVPVLAL